MTVPQCTFPNLYAFSTAVLLVFKNASQALICYFTQQYQQAFHNYIISLFVMATSALFYSGAYCISSNSITAHQY